MPASHWISPASAVDERSRGKATHPAEERPSRSPSLFAALGSASCAIPAVLIHVWQLDHCPRPHSPIPPGPAPAIRGSAVDRRLTRSSHFVARSPQAIAILSSPIGPPAIAITRPLRAH